MIVISSNLRVLLFDPFPSSSLWTASPWLPQLLRQPCVGPHSQVLRRHKKCQHMDRESKDLLLWGRASERRAWKATLCESLWYELGMEMDGNGWNKKPLCIWEVCQEWLWIAWVFRCGRGWGAAPVVIVVITGGISSKLGILKILKIYHWYPQLPTLGIYFCWVPGQPVCKITCLLVKTSFLMVKARVLQIKSR